MSDFTKAPRLYFDKQSVAKYNFDKLTTTPSLAYQLFIQVEMQSQPYQIMLVALILKCVLHGGTQ